MRWGLLGEITVAVCLILVVGSVPTNGTAHVTATPVPAAIGSGTFQTGGVDSDGVVLRANVTETGDARWTIEYRIRLDDANTTAAFRSLQSDIRNNTSRYSARFERRIASTVQTAENTTGREMAVRNVSVTTRIQTFTGADFGFVVYSFTWAGFAETDGGRLIIGDALAGFFLDSNTSLVVAWPPGYTAQSVVPNPDSRPTERSVRWDGERDFGPNQPRVVVAQAGGSSIGTFPLAVGGVLIVLVAVLLVRFRTRIRRRLAGGTADSPETDSASTAQTGDGTASETDSDTPPEELMSPQERVLQLVRDNGGRMKQAEVTDAFDWSAARTSQVVSDLREDGEIESFRLGRENVLRLPEESSPGEEPDSE